MLRLAAAADPADDVDEHRRHRAIKRLRDLTGVRGPNRNPRREVSRPQNAPCPGRDELLGELHKGLPARCVELEGADLGIELVIGRDPSPGRLTALADAFSNVWINRV